MLVLYTEDNPESSLPQLQMLKDIGDLFSAAIVQENARDLLNEASQAAQQNSQLKSDFLASMSHEIRTPMNGIIVMLELLLNSQLTKEQQHKAMLAKSSAQSLLYLINDILDFSKVESGKLELEVVDFNLFRMLGEVIETLALTAQDKGIEIILDTSEINQTKVSGDPVRVRQILTNLVGNGVKFTHKGRIVVTGKLYRENGGFSFTCSVNDSGIGIPEDKLVSLFERFTQVDTSTTREYGGTGLGLSICKKLVELMNGTISVTSEVGQGSEFIFSIPLGCSQESSPVEPVDNCHGLNLLLVDEIDECQNTISAQLKKWGVNTFSAKSCQEAIRLCGIGSLSNEKQKNVNRFDIILINVKSENSKYFELCRKVRDNSNLKATNLVLMAPIRYQYDKKQLLELDINYYFSKPVTVDDLLASLSTIFSTKKIPARIFTSTQQDNIHAISNNLKADSFNSETTRAEFSGSKVLIVEDNQINQQVVLGILAEYGVNAEVAHNGLEALNLINLSTASGHYDLVFMDCQMPEMDGYETTRRIREGSAGRGSKDLIIIAMTANAMDGDREKCLLAGMSDYIAKPLEPPVVYQKLKQWLPINKNKPGKPHLIPDRVDYANDELNLSNGKEAINKLSHGGEKDDSVWQISTVLKRLMGKEKLLIKLIRSFGTEMPERFNLIETYCRDREFLEIEKIAHAIKGVAANLSGLELQQTASKLESISRLKEEKEIDASFKALFDAYHNLSKRFDTYLSAIESKETDQP